MTTSVPYVTVFPCGPLATNAILVACPKTLKAAIIDPAAGSLGVVRRAVARFGVEVEAILLTHSHWDHIADAAAVKREFNVPVLVHPLDADNLARPGVDGIPLLMGAIEGVEADGFLEEAQRVALGSLELLVMHLPGHCPGLVGFYLEREGILISGDLLFRGTIGTLTLPTAEPEKMWQSLERVSRLPAETQVYPGHGESTTLANERWLAQAREIFGG